MCLWLSGSAKVPRWSLPAYYALLSFSSTEQEKGLSESSDSLVYVFRRPGASCTEHCVQFTQKKRSVRTTLESCIHRKTNQMCEILRTQDSTHLFFLHPDQRQFECTCTCTFTCTTRHAPSSLSYTHVNMLMTINKPR